MKPLIVVPTYDGKHDYRLTLMALEASKRVPEQGITFAQSSFLTDQFNKFWCIALNDKRFTHFIMLHADIVPQDDGWEKKIIRLCDEKHADILSVVSPIKNPKGTTSTGLWSDGIVRRLTMKEVFQLPPTFGWREVESYFGKSGQLLVNTGCMCVAMNNRPVLETMLFRVENFIRKRNGQFYAVSRPEDWNWSRDAYDKGLTVMATREIVIDHGGYKNDTPWGDEHDQEEEG